MNRTLAFRRIRQNIDQQRKYIDFSLDMEDLTLLIRLLEFGDFEILRNFKRIGSEDMSLKEIFYYYRYGCRRLRKLLQEKRGF